ncbi:MAG: TonB-dependent receptor [Deltaproteobacteria bacterium]|nr:TonB-dependent receptor [Deltaproteobacteria bacterium]
MRSRLINALTLLVLPILSAADTVTGRVVGESGQPLDRVLVEWQGSSETTLTGRDGRFEISEPGEARDLRFSLTGFVAAQVTVEEERDEPLTITLVRHSVHREEITVAAQPLRDRAPITLAASSFTATELAVPPSTPAELAAHSSSVSENGQGGLFQVLSVRGVSRHRVRSVLAGVPLASERRAGVSASFIDPRLLGSVNVVRGAASAVYGSGALGGVIELDPKPFLATEYHVGFSDQGREAYQALGWGRPEQDLSLGVAVRRADSAETASGETLASGFKQGSALFRKAWKSSPGVPGTSKPGRSYELVILPSFGWDISKANTDFPRRTTIYPRERHLVVSFAAEQENRWRAQVFAHPNDLMTTTSTLGESRSDVVNESLDLGASWVHRYKLGERLRGRFGVDYFGRKGVSATEVAREGEEEPVTLRSLDGAELDELGAFAGGGWSWGPVQLESAFRWSFFRQGNKGASSEREQALNAFLGLVAPLGSGFHLIASAGTGQRLPSLSERFFAGTTGRGGVIGNPDLESETSFNVDLGVRWSGKRSHLAVFVFENRIDDYIERVEVAPDLLTFFNLTSGTLHGVELEGFHQASRRVRFTFGGHWMEGESDQGEVLSDVPSDRLRAGLRISQGSWNIGMEGQYRFSKDDFGSGEKETPGAALLSLSLGRSLTPSISLMGTASNLLDERYFVSADRKAPEAKGRTFGLHLSWSGG